MAYCNITDDSYLTHHGIKGQQWGVRNGPPYPLDTSEHTVSEKKAEHKKALDKHRVMDDNEHNVESLKDNDITKQSGLTEVQKKAIKIGVAVAATFLIAYGTYKLADSGELHRLAEKGMELFQGDAYKGFKRNNSFSNPMTADEIAHTFFGKINPGYGTTIGTSKNCRRCTFAYELSRRGYDVKATRSLQGSGQAANSLNRARGEEVVGIKAILREFSGGLHGDIPDTNEVIGRLINQKRFDLYNANGEFDEPGKKIFEALSHMPEGARGELEAIRGLGGGHSMAWEIINGKPIVFDFQTSNMYDNSQELTNFITEQNFITAGLSRLDDVNLDFDFLRRWVEND